MAVLSEFKQFIIRGNVLDLAVGVIIGGAFNKIVSSLIEDLITPLILNPVMEAAHVSTLYDFVWKGSKPGMFLSAVITFILTGFVLFLIIKAINRLRVKEDAKPENKVVLNTSEKLLTEIRDTLQAQRMN
jgi:large conductance mechanosensitive channel